MGVLGVGVLMCVCVLRLNAMRCGRVFLYPDMFSKLSEGKGFYVALCQRIP